jgi:hypothetical protein
LSSILVKTFPEGQFVEHGDRLSGFKYAQKGRFGKAEHERGLPYPFLITGQLPLILKTFLSVVISIYAEEPEGMKSNGVLRQLWH